jgi:hypothetical protein
MVNGLMRALTRAPRNWGRGASLLLLVGALVAHALPAAAQSQATTAEINGRIVDAQGGVLPGVTVTARAEATGYVRSTVTNAEGYFGLPLLPTGQYELTMELPGFATGSRQVLLTVGATVTVNQTLQVTGVAETISVTAATPLVETTTAVRTSTVNELAIDNLPINGRRFQDFVTLTPTVQVDTSRGQLSFAGQRGINANVNIDGADYNQPFFGGIRGGERSNNAFTVPQESVQEFQVVTAGYSAEFGRSTAGLVNVLTKSGTNQMSGSGIYVNRHRELADKNAFGQTAAPTQQQFGGSVGGPIKTDRLFFFGAYEQQIFRNERAVAFNFSGVTPSADNAEALNYYRSQETDFEATNDAIALLGKIDYQWPAGSRISMRYSHSGNEALNSNAVGNALEATTTSALSNNGTEKNSTNTFVGQYTTALTSSLLLEARGQYSREDRPREANVLAPTVQNQVGNYGTVNFLPTTQEDWRAQAAANVTAVKGTHSLKGGFEYNHVYADQIFGFNQFGRWTVNGAPSLALEVLSVGGPTANRFDVPATGGGATATYLKQLGNLSVDLASDEVALFVQDSWRVKPRLTLNYGVRWEGAFNPTPVANNDFMLNAIQGVTFPLGRTIDPTQIPNQPNQWAPRLGFAWDAAGDGKTVVRGHTGLYYARTPGLLWTSPLNNWRVPAGDLSIQLPFVAPPGNPNTTLYRQLLLIGIDLNQYPLDALPILTTEQMTQIGSALGLTVNEYAGAQPLVVDQDFRNPRATQAGIGVQREVATDISVSAEFLYVKTDFLQRNREVNLGVPSPNPADPSQRPIFPNARPVPQLGSIQIRESTASSEYRALTLSSQMRRARFTVNANYVLSKSESDDDNERDSGGPGAANTYDLSPEWGPARLDRRHQFNGYVLTFLPGNFDVHTGFRFLSALPIDATMGRDADSSRGGPDRPYSAPGVSFVRNGFRNEPFKEVNLRAQWTLGFAGGNRMIFSAEVFNLFNWDNIQLAGNAVTNYCSGTAPNDCGFGAPTNPNFLSLVDRDPNSATNGQLIRTNNPGAPRQLQLGVRFQF